MTAPSFFFALAQIPIGFALSNVTEWLFHKYVLHGLGRQRQTFWSFHWHEHHKATRRHEMYDSDYERSPFAWNAQGKEVAALCLAAIPALLLAPWAPILSLTLLWGGFDYYRKHRHAHLDPAWAREHLPWHVDHHMGRDQDANWCVTHPWCDVLFGTRVPWLGTVDERRARVERADAVS
jgi:hypothetical protein